MDIGKLLRAKDDTSVRDKFTLYLPDRDREQKPIRDIGTWIDSAAYLMAEINGGCTKLPASKGLWELDEGNFILEDTTLVYSYLLKPDNFKRDFYKIIDFFHAFGRETNQHTLFAEMSYFDGKKYVQECYEIPHENYLPAP